MKNYPPKLIPSFSRQTPQFPERLEHLLNHPWAPEAFLDKWLWYIEQEFEGVWR